MSVKAGMDRLAKKAGKVSGTWAVNSVTLHFLRFDYLTDAGKPGQPPEDYKGLPLVIDDSLEDGVIELRAGSKVHSTKVSGVG
jgi:hypothetical protein